MFFFLVTSKLSMAHVYNPHLGRPQISKYQLHLFTKETHDFRLCRVWIIFYVLNHLPEMPAKYKSLTFSFLETTGGERVAKTELSRECQK